jgi:hypothetical protein
MSDGAFTEGPAIAELRTDADRDRIEVQVRLDMVVLVVVSHRGERGQAELAPADARRLGEALARAADAAEQTPRP